MKTQLPVPLIQYIDNPRVSPKHRDVTNDPAYDVTLLYAAPRKTALMDSLTIVKSYAAVLKDIQNDRDRRRAMALCPIDHPNDLAAGHTINRITTIEYSNHFINWIYNIIQIFKDKINHGNLATGKH
jgi:hypothetical protein